jgi:hypothetical protein
MQPLNQASTQHFAPDQRFSWQVEYWDTPFAALENDVASAGLIMDIREPSASGNWNAFKSALKAVGTNTSALTAFQDATNSTATVTSGRVPVLADYWAGGAAGWYGVSTTGRVAYRFRCHLRAASARSWWSSAANPWFFVAVAGQGYVRIEKHVGATTTVVFADNVSEAEFLKRGFKFSADVTDMGAGDYLDIYYVQDAADPWGGYVFKICDGPQAAVDSVNQTAAQQAFVLNCGAFDDTAPPARVVLKNVSDVEIVRAVGQAPTASFSVPLVNTQVQDGFGWEWYRPVASSNGQLRLWDGGAATSTILKRKRLARVKQAYVLAEGTATGTQTSTTFQDLTQNFTDGALTGMVVEIVSGTGVGQYRTIASNTTTTLTVPAWTVTPDATSRYVLKEEYTVFTGFIHDYADPERGQSRVECAGLESRLLEQFDKNYPDKVSYMSWGYRKIAETTDPVYDTTCYDNWPLEFAVADLLLRAGIAPSRIRQPLTVGKDDGSTSTVQFNYGAGSVLGNTTETLAKFRARTVAGKYLKLSRQVNYGNAGLAYTEAKAVDDPYIFPPENTKELWNRVREMTDRYGYDCWFDEQGAAWLQPRSTAFAAVQYQVPDASGAGSGVTVTQKLAPSAFAGYYVETVGSPITFSKTVTAARIDISFPTGASLGLWRVKISKGGVAQNGANGVVVNPATGSQAFYYDQYQTVNGVNSTVVTVWSGEYATYQVDVIAEPATADTTVVRRLDSIFLFHTDPALPRLPQVLSTKVNAPSITPKSNMDDMRNLVTVVGQRKAVTTDSAKFNDQNPSNPEAEFIVERQVNAASIVDPTSDTFIGYKKESVIYDQKITSPDMASYLANLFIYRQKNPAPSASVVHTALPALQLRDPVYAQDELYQLVTSNTVLFVQAIRHRFSDKRVETTVELTPFQEYPAFAPREDVDIDANYLGQPVVNVQLQYAALTGQTRTNLPLNAVRLYDDTADIVTRTAAVQTGGLWGDYLDLATAPWPPVPGTLQISATNQSTSGAQTANLPGTIASYLASGTNANGYYINPLPLTTQGLGIGSHVQYQLGNFSSITSLSCAAYASTPVYDAAGTLLGYQYKYRGPVSTGYGLFGTNTSAAMTYSWNSFSRILDIYHERTTFGEPKEQISYFFTATGPGLPKSGEVGYKANNPHHHFFNIDYRNLGAQDNLARGANDLTGSTFWSPFGLTSRTGGQVAPDGSTTAVLCVESTAATTSHGIDRNPGNNPVTPADNSTLTVSCWAKAKERTWFRLFILTKTNVVISGFFDLAAGALGGVTAGGTTRITAYPDGWYRCELSANVLSGATTVNYGLRLAPSNGVGTYTGDGVSGLYVWGPQVNSGTAAHAFVSTTTTPLTNQVVGAKVHLPWVEGDGTSSYQRPASTTQYTVRYRSFFPGGTNTDPYGGVSPFYDPYTSELGYLVNLSFDALVTGFYRISVRSAKDNTVVAWLTEPTADPDKPESHFAYLTAGAAKTFAWDGVDQRGEWNATQSEWYATASQGAFEKNEKPIIGKGFYVWNREVDSNGQLGPLAFIAGDVDAQGEPIFGQGTFGTWYVLIEVQNDRLAEVAAANPADAVKGQLPRRVSSDSLVTTNGLNSTSAAYVFTHLPRPTRCTLELSDWKSMAPTFDDSNPSVYANEANWIAITDPAYLADNPDAAISNQRPVRVRFVVEQRPGVLWTGRANEASVKTFRVAHPRVTIMDQFVTWDGSLYPLTTVPNRRITSRRLMNDSHTLVYEDESFRKGYTFKNAANLSGGTVEWIFAPKYFKKEFRVAGVTEAIRFGDYLQLEEVPTWDPTKAAQGVQARFQLAFLSYLWYLSAYTQDRSGRLTWALDRTFLDPTKIPINTVAHWPDKTVASSALLAKATSTSYRLEWPSDPLREHRRTVLTRQWTDEGTWKADQKSLWGFATGSIGDALLKHKWQDHSPNATTLNGTAWTSYTGITTDDYSRYHRDVPNGLRLPGSFPTARQLGTTSASALGSWTWQTAPAWAPSVTRDFHPYFLVPPMMSPNPGSSYRTNDIYTFTDMSAASTDSSGQTMGNDEAKLNTWSTPIWDQTQSYSANNNDTDKVRFWPGHTVKKDKWPTNTVNANTLDYVRQDETLHYEQLRGFYAHREKPAQSPVRVVAGNPYYVNQFTYASILGTVKDGYPQYSAVVSDWFTLNFRSEYVWESETLFPARDAVYAERLDAMHLGLTRYDRLDRSIKETLRYDTGAWTGWKPDLGTTTVTGVNGTSGNVFDGQTQPIALGPKPAGITRDCYFHLVLVPSRR